MFERELTSDEHESILIDMLKSKDEREQRAACKMIVDGAWRTARAQKAVATLIRQVNRTNHLQLETTVGGEPYLVDRHARVRVAIRNLVSREAAAYLVTAPEFRA